MMKDDELQVLGARRKMSKREKWKYANWLQYSFVGCRYKNIF